jgi:hypothetical protein
MSFSVEMELPNGKTVKGSGPSGSIRVSLEQLKSYRGKSPKPDELEWEIRLYEFILAQPDPDLAADLYFKRRNHGHGLPPLRKRDVARKLGWEVA